MVTFHKLKRYFPLKNINDVLILCEELLDSNAENDADHNIIFISILLGLIEYKLTQTNENEDIENDNSFQNNENYANVHIFTILFSDVKQLYKSFQLLVNEIGIDKLFKKDRRYINRAHLKLITDAIFSKLSVAKYKENCHNQSIFSFLTDKSLDSFGLAYTILSVSHQLGYRNVYLALSEDHAWLEYDGDNGDDNDDDHTVQRFTADIAWTGKNEDKRCSSIDLGILERSRLYLGGNSVVCADNSLTMVAAITTINPAKGSSSLSTNAYSNRSQNVTSCHSLELAILKRDLLWIAYNRELLTKYPLAVINLADLERNYPKLNSDKNRLDYPLILYREAVDINVQYYDNCHVYPYLSMANYFCHYCHFLRAMKCWRMAANVISKYNYKSEDWIIYREFFDIATHFIPDIFRTGNKDDNPISIKSSESLYQESTTGSIKNVKKSPDNKDILEVNVDQRESFCEELKGSSEFLTEFLCFFDFICLWEEGSSVPVLHEVWANKFKEILTKFTEDTRVSLKMINADADILSNNRSIDQVLSLPNLEPCHIRKTIANIVNSRAKESLHRHQRRHITSKSTKDRPKKSSLSTEEVNQLKDFWKALTNDDVSGLSSILSSKVLNFNCLTNENTFNIYDFGIFPEQIDYDNIPRDNSSQVKLQQDFIDYFSAIKNIKRILSNNGEEVGFQKPNGTSVVTKLEDTAKENVVEDKDKRTVKQTASSVEQVPLMEVLKSQKMKEICPLIVARGRLNIPAIKLPLTAQSQVSLKRTGLKTAYGSHSHEFSSTYPRKRFRRD